MKGPSRSGKMRGERKQRGDVQADLDQTSKLHLAESGAPAAQDLVKLAVEKALTGMPGRKTTSMEDSRDSVGNSVVEPLQSASPTPAKDDAQTPNQPVEGHHSASVGAVLAGHEPMESNASQIGVNADSNSTELASSATSPGRRSIRVVLTPCADGSLILPPYEEIIASEQRAVQAPPAVMWERDATPFVHVCPASDARVSAGFESLQFMAPQAPEHQLEKEGQPGGTPNSRQQSGRELLALLQDGLKHVSPREHQAWTIPAAWRQ